MLSNEQSTRLKILDSLLQSTHRDINQVVDTHKTMIQEDPLFYAHLAVWAMDNTEIRDHKEVFVASLLLSEFPEHREAGYMLLQDFPPYQVERIKDHVKMVFKKNPPRIMKTAVKNYLRAIESNVNRFDGAVVKQHRALTGLYASFKIKPNERAQATLFDNNPPADSKMAQVKLLAATTDPTEQARIIVEKNIPYTTAVGALENLTPTVLAASINQMTEQEVLVNISSLKKRGALDNPDLKSLVEEKLVRAKKSTKVDALKAQKASEAAGLDADLTKKLVEISDARVKSLGRISKSTALLIDKSSSMEQAIEIGKQVGALVSSITESNFYCWAFDDHAVQIKCQSNSLDDWTKAFRMVRAGSATSCGSGIAQLVLNNQLVEQIIMVTDQDENRNPFFEAAMNTYKQKFGFYPRMVFVNCGRAVVKKLEVVCQANKIEYEVFNVPSNADYYSLPNLIPLLSKPGRVELLNEIMNTTLPTRV